VPELAHRVIGGPFSRWLGCVPIFDCGDMVFSVGCGAQVCRDAAMMTMRKAVEGKSPAEIVELQQSGALEGEVQLQDFEEALRRTQPTVTSDDLLSYAAWNAEFGCNP